MAYLNFLRESGPLGGTLLQHVSAAIRSELSARVPSACALCQGGSKGGELCVHCQGLVLASMAHGGERCRICSLRLDGRPKCPDCLRGRFAFDRVIAAFDYASPGDLLIHQLKRQGRFISARMLAGLLADAVNRSEPRLCGATILVSVPSSRAAVLRRGFNPAAEVAQSLSRRLRLAYRPEWLVRIRDGESQTRLNRRERSLHAQSLFRCAGDVTNRDIAVVDDVLTTGSTLHSIAHALKAEGAASVCGLVLARTPY
jgi:ComF family protein